VASAANTRTGELLLRFLSVTGWDVDLRPAVAGVTLLAVQPGDDGPLRISAWGRTPEAASFAAFAQARVQNTR
jgi:hypothetical protein